jgi:hypothetical protein
VRCCEIFVQGRGFGVFMVACVFSAFAHAAVLLICFALRPLALSCAPTAGVTTGPSNAVDLYNSATGMWSTAQLSVARYWFAAASVGNVALFAGGWTGSALLCREEGRQEC